MAIRIRPAQNEDRKEALDVTLAAYQQYASQMPEHWPHYRDNIVRIVADPHPAELFVAEQDGEIVGSVLLFPAGMAGTGPDGQPVIRPWPEVRLLAVTPAARGQGIGTALMHECMVRAREAGAAALMLHTTDLMQVAMHMYERMGFERAPALDYHPAPGVTVKAYRYDLAEPGEP